MLVGRKSSWYRPYYVVASNKEYRVDKIHFYKDNEILVTANSSWLENKNGNDIDSIELPVEEIKVKRKEKFDGKVFVMSRGKENYGNDLLADIYIPAEMLDIHFVGNEIKYKTQVRAIYEGSSGIYIDTYIKSIDDKLSEIRTKYEKIHKLCDDYNLAYHTEEFLNNLDTLKKLAKEYMEEKKRVENLTINDIEL